MPTNKNIIAATEMRIFILNYTSAHKLITHYNKINWITNKKSQLEKLLPYNTTSTVSDTHILFLDPRSRPSLRSPLNRACTTFPWFLLCETRLLRIQHKHRCSKLHGLIIKKVMEGVETHWNTKSGIVSCSRGTYLNSCRRRST